jgi:hypothetical protein
MINIEIISKLPPAKRKILIEQCLVDAPSSIDEDLKESYAYSRVINTFIEEYIKRQVIKDQALEKRSVLTKENLTKKVKVEIEEFIPLAISALKNSIPSIDELKLQAKNLFEISGVRRLAFGNKATRTLSTTMGSLWERLANISPYAVITEQEFGIKLKGIDLILLNCSTDIIEYAQLKTKQDTLTGSQKSRSVKELSIHDNPIFCACFETKAGWTFNDSKVSRYAGEEVWNRIGMDYSIILESVVEMIKVLEGEYVDLLNTIK